MARDRSHEELSDSGTLDTILEDMKASFGGFSDLGVIEADGTQLSYAGPYELEGRNYRDYPWFQEVTRQGTYVSEVFLGYRDFPHFVIASIGRSAGGRVLFSGPPSTPSTSTVWSGVSWPSRAATCSS